MNDSNAHNPGLSTDTNHFPRSAPSDPSAPHVQEATVVVDAARDRGALTRLWESIGYDELNWTHTRTGRARRGLTDRSNETLADTSLTSTSGDIEATVAGVEGMAVLDTRSGSLPGVHLGRDGASRQGRRSSPCRIRLAAETALQR